MSDQSTKELYPNHTKPVHEIQKAMFDSKFIENYIKKQIHTMTQYEIGQLFIDTLENLRNFQDFGTGAVLNGTTTDPNHETSTPTKSKPKKPKVQAQGGATNNVKHYLTSFNVDLDKGCNFLSIIINSCVDRNYFKDEKFKSKLISPEMREKLKAQV